MKSLDIHTNRLLLRKFRPDDQQNVFRGLSHPEVIKYYGISYKSFEDTKEQMEWFEKLEENGTGKWWAICSGDDTNFYGAIGINNLSAQHKKAELGYWLLPEYWGKGFILEAAPKVLNYCFSFFNLHRIEALVESQNEASSQLLKKLQFKYEGTMVDCEIKNGNFISLEIYAHLSKSAIE